MAFQQIIHEPNRLNQIMLASLQDSRSARPHWGASALVRLLSKWLARNEKYPQKKGIQHINSVA